MSRVVPEVDGRAGVEAASEALLAAGALVVREAVPAEEVGRADRELAPHFASVPFSVGRFYGDRTVRFGRLFARSEALRPLAIDPLVHGVAAHVLGRWHRTHSISFAQAIAVHPGAPVQAPHRDGEMWPVTPTGGEHLVSVMWPLTRFDDRTGATRVWLDGLDGAPCQPVLDPGDALVFLGSTTHGAGANVSAEVRRGVVVGYAASWLIPAENPILAHPPEVARTMPRRLAQLLGYRRFAPNLNNFDCRCPSELLDGQGGAGAVDELNPEQVEGLDRFYAAMEAAD